MLTKFVEVCFTEVKFSTPINHYLNDLTLTDTCQRIYLSLTVIVRKMQRYLQLSLFGNDIDK